MHSYLIHNEKSKEQPFIQADYQLVCNNTIECYWFLTLISWIDTHLKLYFNWSSLNIIKQCIEAAEPVSKCSRCIPLAQRSSVVVLQFYVAQRPPSGLQQPWQSCIFAHRIHIHTYHGCTSLDVNVCLRQENSLKVMVTNPPQSTLEAPVLVVAIWGKFHWVCAQSRSIVSGLVRAKCFTRAGLRNQLKQTPWTLVLTVLHFTPNIQLKGHKENTLYYGWYWINVNDLKRTKKRGGGAKYSRSKSVTRGLKGDGV